MTSTEYFIWTTKEHVTAATAAEIEAALQRIDPSANFVRHHATGADARAWIVRPNDGANDQEPRRSNNRQLEAKAKEIIRANRRHSQLVVTWQSPNGSTLSVCETCRKNNAPEPRDSAGQEYCTVSHGLHRDACSLI